ncbi:MAG: hypothetical protein Q9157_004632 [Trypethelium eluteriae]
MYLWYEKANKCYTYLEDVPADVNTKSIGSELTRTGWATRGWTLQELLAPPVVMFYSKDWVQIGTKDTLSYVLSRTTGIDEDLLTRKKVLDQASIAKRMFWAGRRNVTRPEDIAYCLMGIFSVNMPMLYGEGGTKAFLRLQEEIMKHSDDHSIFAWTDEEASSDAFHGLLAVHPSRFRLSKSVIPYKDREERVSYSMSNRGVCIELYLTHLPDEGPNIYAAPLDCPVPPRFGDHAFLAIYLQKLPGGQRQYTRVKIGCLAEIRDRGALHTIYVRQAIVIPTLAGVYPSHVLQLRKVTGTFPEYKVVASMVPPAADGAKATLSSKAAYFGVGFDVVELEDLEVLATRQDRFDIFQQHYTPKSMGSRIRVGYHRIYVKAEPLLRGSAKYYMIDIELEAVERPTKPIDVILDKIENLIEPATDTAGPTSHRRFGRLRRVFGSSEN